MCLVHCPDSSDCERHLVPDDGPQQLHQPDHLRGLLLLRETSQSFCQHKHHTGHDPLLQQATTIGQEVIWSFQPRRNTRKSERCNDREAESPNLTLTSSLSPSLPVVTTSIWNTVTKPPPPRAWCQNSKCWRKIILSKSFNIQKPGFTSYCFLQKHINQSMDLWPVSQCWSMYKLVA